MKNILILALNKDMEFCDFTDENNEFKGNFNNVNEAITKYLIYKSERENKALDYIFLLANSVDIESGNYEKFKNIFPQIPMDYTLLNSGSIKENLPLASDVFDKIISYKNDLNDDLQITINLTDNFEYNSIITSLIELIEYNNFNINSVLYVNAKTYPHIIEEVMDFIKLPTLINGANEFISFGNTDKIQNFFSCNEPNEHIKILIEKMTALSDTLRICGSYEVTENATQEFGNAVKNYEKSLDVKLNNLLNKTNELSDELKNCANFETAEDILAKLNKAIDEYKETVKNKEPININEFYFSKLLPKIKSEYDEILPVNSKKSTPIDIIRWCLKSGLIQQGITFYAEWLPRFLIENNYIKILDKSIPEDCSTNIWTHWSNQFFRNYQVKPAFENVTQTKTSNVYLHNELRNSYDTGNVENVLKALKGRDKKLENFLKYIREFSNKYTLAEAPKKIAELSEDSLIKTLLRSAVPKNENFNKFLLKRLNKEKSVEKVIIKSFAHMPKNLNSVFYTNDIKQSTEEVSHKKLKNKKDLFEYLIENKKISVSIREENFLYFIEIYDLIVSGLRNKFAHAIADTNMIENQNDIARIIEKSLDLIDVK